MGNCESDYRNPNAFSANNAENHSHAPRPVPTVQGTFPSGTKSRDVDVVNVIVPAGVYAGQTINVVAPDGRIVSAVVPNGMGAGSQFMVRFPPSSAPSAPVEAPAEPFKPDYPAATPTGSTAYPMAAATLVNEAEEPPPFSLALDLPPPTYNSNTNAASVTGMGMPQQPAPYQLPQQQQSASAVPPGQKLVRVQVPPGVAPGTMISIQIPDEPSRIVTAQVPPNATEFNVAYYPSTIPTVTATSSSYNYNNNAYQGPTPPSMPPIPAYNSFPPQNKYNKYSNNNNGYNNNYNNNSNNNNRPGIGGYILPVLGGAAIGAAAMELFDGDDWGDW